MTTIGQLAHGRNNNFNLIRVIAAGAVIVSHAWLLTEGPAVYEPLERILGVTLGVAGVFVFFAISGFLITRSFDCRPDHAEFIAARLLRLFPALLTVLALTAFVLGPIISTLPTAVYFAAPETWTYLPRNATLLMMQYPLPGVFEELPYPDTVNGALWSLFYEVTCYGMVFTLGLLGGLRDPRRFSAFIAFYAVGFAAVEILNALGVSPHRVSVLQQMSFPFVLGMAFYYWRDRIPLSWTGAAVLIILAVLAHGGPAFPYVFVVALCYGVFVLAYLPGGAVRRYNNLGDYSYGLYIYGFPVQQLLVQQMPYLGPVGNALASLSIALALAALSWRWIEAPTLREKQAFGHKLRQWWSALRPNRGVTPAK